MPFKVTIRLKHSGPVPQVSQAQSPAAEFWSATKHIPAPSSGDIAAFEAQLRTEFPQKLRQRFISHYLYPAESSFREGESTSKSEPDSTRTLGRITFSIDKISYGSPVLNLDVALSHAGDLVAFLGITPDDALQVLALQAPGALNQALAVSEPWETEVAVRSFGDLGSTTNQATANSGATTNQATASSGAASNSRLQTLINAAWALPFLAALGVLTLLIVESSNRLRSYDTEIMSIKSAEVARSDTRLRALDKHTADLLARYDKIIAQYAEPPKSAEVTRLDQRVVAFEKQISDLSSKYESIAKQQGELLKRLQARAERPNKSRGGRGRRSGRNR